MTSFVKIHVMHCGDVKVDKRLAFKDNVLSNVPKLGERSKEDQIWIPVSCYLIEHPLGLTVIDAGWSEKVRTSPEEQLGYAYQYCHPRLLEGQSIKEQLAVRNLTPSDIDYPHFSSGCGSYKWYSFTGGCKKIYCK
ncbi:hypothetical protein [Neobacillus massiliamazoniensis]|uniref:Uncharacterized protein n=1 Tax=Neobacillus massiliamazoniensis TaxID=1499688 RepID=A0A0U1NY19_9BACI|nr:hypothetical protein [Neobacillus massiliamazoniensis]CRK82914.1 hypothetical protein BN000_02869 [Neobacillus massiliamazoniensis]